MINFNPQVLTDAFTVSSQTYNIPMGDTVQVLENNPNRIAVIFTAGSGPSTLNITPPTTASDGMYIYFTGGNIILDYRNHGAMVGYSWYAYNSAMMGDVEVSVIQSSYRPQR